MKAANPVRAQPIDGTAGDRVYVEPKYIRVFPPDGRPGMVLQVARAGLDRYSDALAARKA
jgi:hypothetical protein